MSSSATSSTVGSRGRTAFRLDALLEMTLGLVCMGNPLFGPALGMSGYLVMLFGFVLLVVAIFLGGAGMGKGVLGDKLAVVRTVNVVCALVFTVWALLGSLNSGARIFLVVVGCFHLLIAALQERALRQPEPKNVRLPSTHAQRQAALRGELNSDEPVQRR